MSESGCRTSLGRRQRCCVMVHFIAGEGDDTDALRTLLDLHDAAVVNTVTIAFDIDGTLRDNTITNRYVANERIRTLLITLASMKNTHILLWSGGGEGYARRVANALGIEEYVDEYGDKGFGGYEENGRPIFHTDRRPDIAVDDIAECALGTMNLIVEEKGFTPGYVPPQARNQGQGDST